MVSLVDRDKKKREKKRNHLLKCNPEYILEALLWAVFVFYSMDCHYVTFILMCLG